MLLARCGTFTHGNIKNLELFVSILSPRLRSSLLHPMKESLSRQDHAADPNSKHARDSPFLLEIMYAILSPVKRSNPRYWYWSIYDWNRVIDSFDVTTSISNG